MTESPSATMMSWMSAMTPAAANPKFQSGSVTGYASGVRDAYISFKLVGLGAAQGDLITVSGSYSLSYRCVAKSDPNKYSDFFSNRAYSAGNSFTADKNGSITKSNFKLSGKIGGPSLCPGGWTLDTANPAGNWLYLDATSWRISDQYGASDSISLSVTRVAITG